MAQLKNISAFILHLPDLLNVRFLLFLLSGIITTQKAEALDLPWKKTSCPPPPCPPFLSGPVEEVISTDLCVTRTVPTQQRMPPSLRNTVGPKGLRKEKGKKVCTTSWGGGLLAKRCPQVSHSALVVLAHLALMSAGNRPLHSASLGSHSYKPCPPVRLLPEACPVG